jgi:hypothetical protein
VISFSNLLAWQRFSGFSHSHLSSGAPLRDDNHAALLHTNSASFLNESGQINYGKGTASNFLILQTIPLFGGLLVGTTESINELIGYKMFHGYAIYL